VWRLDEETYALVSQVPGHAVDDVAADERGNCGCKTSPGPAPFADDIAVPGAGVFRVSRMGKLEKLLDAHLAVVRAPRALIDPRLELGTDGQFAALSRGVPNGPLVNGVLGVRG
jgi:hypothetical protein